MSRFFCRGRSFCLEVLWALLTIEMRQVWQNSGAFMICLVAKFGHPKRAKEREQQLFLQARELWLWTIMASNSSSPRNIPSFCMIVWELALANPVICLDLREVS